MHLPHTRARLYFRKVDPFTLAAAVDLCLASQPLWLWTPTAVGQHWSAAKHCQPMGCPTTIPRLCGSMWTLGALVDSMGCGGWAAGGSHANWCDDPGALRNAHPPGPNPAGVSKSSLASAWVGILPPLTVLHCKRLCTAQVGTCPGVLQVQHSSCLQFPREAAWPEPASAVARTWNCLLPLPEYWKSTLAAPRATWTACTAHYGTEKVLEHRGKEGRGGLHCTYPGSAVAVALASVSAKGTKQDSIRAGAAHLHASGWKIISALHRCMISCSN
jgi:hypothetical protein